MCSAVWKRTWIVSAVYAREGRGVVRRFGCARADLRPSARTRRCGFQRHDTAHRLRRAQIMSEMATNLAIVCAAAQDHGDAHPPPDPTPGAGRVDEAGCFRPLDAGGVQMRRVDLLSGPVTLFVRGPSISLECPCR